jgi:hypothetical protein
MFQETRIEPPSAIADQCRNFNSTIRLVHMPMRRHSMNAARKWGNSTRLPPTTAWQHGVQRRAFDNGMSW